MNKITTLFALTAVVGARCLGAGATDWFPFSPSFGGATNVTDFSALVEAPAGKHGFVGSAGERFVTQGDREIRFNGVNFTAEACFPETGAAADQVAARLARFGVNCVRLHYFDAPVTNRWTGEMTESIFGKTPSVSPDPQRLARFDRLVWALKQKGIYIDINLHVGRKLDERLGYPRTQTMQDKGCTVFSRRLIDAQKAYAKDILTHVNPFTRLRYCDDPAVALVEIANEDGALAMNMFTEFDRLGPAYRAELVRLYGRNLPRRLGANPPTSAVELREWHRFLYDLEVKYYREMCDYLKEHLGVRVPIGGSQVRFSPSLIQSELDFTDNHDYWCHPKDFTRDAFGTYENTSSLVELSVFRKMLGARVADKPHTFTEYNQPFPNEYGAEGQLLLHAYAAMQGWAGVWGYTYSRYANYAMRWTGDWFNLASRADVMVHFPACAAMFLRGDVEQASTRVDYEMTEEASRALLDPYDYRLYQTIADAGGDYGEALTNVVSLRFVRDPDAKTGRRRVTTAGRTVPQQLAWTGGKDAYWTCRTRGVKLFQGFVRGRTFDLGDGVSVAPGETLNDWCTISFTANKGRVLLAATGVSRNTGMRWKEGPPAEGVEVKKPDFVIEAGAYFDRTLKPNDRRLTDWGRAPTINEPVPAKIVWPGAKRVWALNGAGERRGSVPVAADGSFAIGREKTLWYEIEGGTDANKF